jgi:ABC-type branched-subunit amino acid transport system ATPase component
MNAASPSLEIKSVSAGYGASDIIHSVSIVVTGGLVSTIAGPNGAGKSTLVKAIAGLLRPGAGAIVMDGRDITDFSPSRRALAGLGYVPQEQNVFRNLSVQENLLIGFEFVRRGAPASQYLTARDSVLSLFPDLTTRLNDAAGTLSGGQRQMLATGCALMAEPRILLLDEPSAGLSPRYAHEMLEAVRAINARGVTVLLVEQNLVEAVQISHNVIVLAAGKVQGTWAAADFLGDPTVQRLFLGGRERRISADQKSGSGHAASAA